MNKFGTQQGHSVKPLWVFISCANGAKIGSVTPKVTKKNWVAWPDYLSIGFVHTAEILETNDSIARYSAQSKESKNFFATL